MVYVQKLRKEMPGTGMEAERAQCLPELLLALLSASYRSEPDLCSY